MSEEDICKVILPEEIHSYAEMTLFSELGAGITEMLKYLHRFGKNAKEVQQNISAHMIKCKECSTRYRTDYETLKMHSQEILQQESSIYLRLGCSTEDLSSLKNLHAVRSSWAIDHVMYEDPEGLKNYMNKKSVAETDNAAFKEQQEFEDHINGCESCKSKYVLDKKLAALFSGWRKKSKKR